MTNKILIYNSGGGIGDSIQLIPLILSLKNHFKNSDLFYLGAHENHFEGKLKEYKINIKTLDLKLKYFGFRWWHYLKVKKNILDIDYKQFELIIDLQSKIRNTLILKMIPHEYFISSTFNFKFSKPKIKVEKTNNINNNILKSLNIAFNSGIKLIEYDTKKINPKFTLEAKNLLPNKNYVGLSITQGNVYRKKEWPMENIVNLCKKLKLINKIPVFFIEKKNKELKNTIAKIIPYALFPEHKSDLSSPALVTSLGKRLDFAISIDNGIMHMLSLSKIPMIVLFGPTNSEKFAPNYNKLIILDSKKLKNTSDISSITSEDVLQAAKQHLNFSY